MGLIYSLLSAVKVIKKVFADKILSWEGKSFKENNIVILLCLLKKKLYIIFVIYK